MSTIAIRVTLSGLLAGLTLLLSLRTRIRARKRRLAKALFSESSEQTTLDDSGAVRSMQSADLLLGDTQLEQIWSPMHLERLARTYWRFLSRVTLGLIRVRYTERERFVVLISKHLKLLTFKAPEYELNPDRGVVRWRIERGLLVARRGRGGGGHLQIEVTRWHTQNPGTSRLHVEIEVANFYPAIASIGRRVYEATQSRIHVIVTRGFLRSLARLDLAESRVGLLAEARPEAEADTLARGEPKARA